MGCGLAIEEFKNTVPMVIYSPTQLLRIPGDPSNPFILCGFGTTCKWVNICTPNTTITLKLYFGQGLLFFIENVHPMYVVYPLYTHNFSTHVDTRQ